MSATSHEEARALRATDGRATTGRPPKSHDNTKVQAFLEGYSSAHDLCEDYSQIDDIFSGALALKTDGCTATRSLSRQALFHILQWCPTVNVESINKATNGRYAYRSLAGYAAVARVASKAIERFIGGLPEDRRKMGIKQAQQALDAPYHAELAALGLI